MTATADPETLPSVGGRAAFATATAGFTALIAAPSFFLLFFLTDVAMVPASLVGTALLLGKLWDTVNDPLFGWLLDRTRHKWPLGRWLVLGALPLAVATAALWWVPPGLSQLGRAVWITGTYLVFDTLFTGVGSAFGMLAADATTQYDARTRFMSFGAVGAVVGFAVGASSVKLAQHFVKAPATAYLLGGIGMGVLAGLGALLAGFFMHEKRKPKPAEARLRGIAHALTQRPFVLLALASAFSRVGFTLVSALLPYYAKYVLGDAGAAATLVLTMLAMVGVSVPLWRRWAIALGKAKAYAVSLLLVAGLMASFFVLSSQTTWLVYSLVALLGFAMAGHWVIPSAILPDVVDWDEAQTGERRLGVYAGVFGLVDKLARTAAFAAVGWSLGASGFVPNELQSAPSLLTIRLLFGPVSAAFVLVAVPLLFAFPIDRVAHAAIRARLEGGAS